jgi:ABC-type lipoprotein release transport system permease subunit
MMAFSKLWVIAFRDLGRNRRRTILTMIAVALGLGLVIMMSGFIAGALEGSLQNNIRLNTGHIQLRAESYEIEKLSLLWQDLIQNSDQIVTQASSLSEVQSATPELWASGVLSTIQESVGVRVTGIVPQDPFHDPIREGLVAGAFLNAEDRGQILLGNRLANSMGIGVGQKVSLAVGNPDGEPEEGIFTVAGFFNTGIPSFDENTVIMPLSQAQAFTRTGDRASAIVIMLHEQDEAGNIASSLQVPGVSIYTWEDMNSVLLQSIQTGMAFYIILYAIVILVVAVVIANTLLMAVFERTREMGILSALGMKGRQIMLMFLLEAAILAVVGIAIGIVLGSAGVAYLVNVGIPIGEASASLAEGIAVGSTMYGHFVPGDVISLSVAMLVIILLVSLYPAWFASRLEPVKALQTI